LFSPPDVPILIGRINYHSGHYNGEKPLYAIISGQREAVKLFIRRFSKQMGENGGSKFGMRIPKTLQTPTRG